MAEPLTILGGVQACSQLLEQAIVILSRLRAAYKRQKEMASILRRHETEAKNIRTVIQVIEKQEALRSAEILNELRIFEEARAKLSKLLERLDLRSRSTVSKIFHQLTQGSDDEKELANVMNELSQVKLTLVMRIQVAHVGLTERAKNQIEANMETIKSLDKFLRDKLGNENGLKIARILSERYPAAPENGIVLLTAVDIALLQEDEEDSDSDDETLVSDSGASDHPADQPGSKKLSRSERIFIRNAARDQAVQIGGPLGEDLWKHVARVEMRDCVAEGEAIQIGYAIATDSFSLVLAEQQRRIKEKERRQQQESKAQNQRRDSAIAR